MQFVTYDFKCFIYIAFVNVNSWLNLWSLLEWFSQVKWCPNIENCKGLHQWISIFLSENEFTLFGLGCGEIGISNVANIIN